MRIITLIVAAGLAAGMQCADAQTLYKLIDKSGKITYSEAKPKDFDGQVIELNIDPNANTATLPKYTNPAPGKEGGPPAPGKQGATTKVDPVAAAQARLDKAKAALQEAKDNAQDSDYNYLGTKGAASRSNGGGGVGVNGSGAGVQNGGGSRRVPSEAYQARLDQLEKDVQDAEDNLALAQKGK